jgi:hypothetical protein
MPKIDQSMSILDRFATLRHHTAKEIQSTKTEPRNKFEAQSSKSGKGERMRRFGV